MKRKNEANTEKQSWWISIPGLLTAIAAVIVAVSTLLGTINETNWIFPTLTPAVIPSPIPTLTPLSFGCGNYERGMENTDILINSTSNVLFRVSASTIPTMDARLLRLKADSQEIGKIKFLFSESDDTFEIDSVVDRDCRPVPQSNSLGTSIPPGVSIFIKNGETVSLKFDGQEYTLRLTYKDNKIEGDFQ
jgi:hypothetical protein